MGKRLIIKGANFSENSINAYTDTWYVLGSRDLTGKKPTVGSNVSNMGRAVNNSIQNLFRSTDSIRKPINMIQYYAFNRAINSISEDCSFRVGKARRDNAVTLLATITVTPDTYKTYQTYIFPESIYIESDEYLVIGLNGDTVDIFTYSFDNIPYRGWYDNITLEGNTWGTSQINASATMMGGFVDVGYRQCND